MSALTISGSYSGGTCSVSRVARSSRRSVSPVACPLTNHATVTEASTTIAISGAPLNQFADVDAADRPLLAQLADALRRVVAPVLS